MIAEDETDLDPKNAWYDRIEVSTEVLDKSNNMKENKTEETD